MTPHDLTEFYIRTQRHGNTTACIQAANAAGAVVLVPTELEARRVRKLGARAFSLSRGARELVGSSDAFVVDPTVLAVAGAEWSAQVSGLEVERDEATRALVDARADVARLKAENDRLTSELAEAQAALANERGEGEPPCEGWATKRNPMLNDIPDNWWWERHLVMVFRRRDSGWDRNEYVPDRGVVVTSHPTARAAMMAPSAAKVPSAP